LYSMGFICNGV